MGHVTNFISLTLFHEIKINMADTVGVSQLWTTLKEAFNEAMELFVPHKLCKPRDGLPFITTELKRLMRKRDRVFFQMKKLQRSVSNHDRAAHLRLKHTDLKHKVQKEIRRAYWTYVESIITPLEIEKNQSNKRLFTYLKMMIF